METPTIKKPLDLMIQENNEHRKLMFKTFKCKDTENHYQLVMFAFDSSTYALQAVYCLIAFPAIKYTKRMPDFLQQFEVVKTPDR
jgi:hypothetical protein